MNIYVLFVLGKSEHRIKEFINANTFHEAIVPVKVKLLKRKATIIKQEVMLFPRYVFVRSDLDAQSFKVYSQRHLAHLSGFIRLLAYKDNDVSALSREEVKVLNPFFTNKGQFEPSIGFIKNERVTITEGPLVGLESKIKHIDRHKKEAIVELTLFNEVKEVKVSCEILSKLI
jgi:transcription termination/antitermination protein NusG